MARIKIEDLPVLEEIQQEELKGIFGGQSQPSGDPLLQPPPEPEPIDPTGSSRVFVGL